MTKTQTAKSTAKAKRTVASSSPTSTLTRPQNPMPAFVHQALVDENLLEAYRRRPPFQQNDWLGWIARAKQEPTKARRLASMLKELRQGHGYMGMTWTPQPGAEAP